MPAAYSAPTIAPHARADDEVGMDARLVEHLEHADVGEPARAARAQHERQRGTLGRGRGGEARQPLRGDLLGVAGREGERQAEEERAQAHP
jgi:hypothetical protein